MEVDVVTNGRLNWKKLAVSGSGSNLAGEASNVFSPREQG
jgi:hypothetical protein